MLKSVIFDMDGVICDTEPIYKTCNNEFFREQNLPVDEHYQDQFLGVTSEFMWGTIIKEFSLPFTIEECVDIVDKKKAAIEKRDGLHPLPHVIDLIKALHADGLTLAIASSSPMSEINRVVDSFGIREYFSIFVTGTECENSKPEPEIFLKAAALLGSSPEECIVIEDSRNGLLAASKANMKSIGFQNPLFLSQDFSLATHIVTSFSEVTPALCHDLIDQQ